MQTLDFTGENAAIIGDSFGPIPCQFKRTGFDFTGAVIKYEVYKDDPSNLKFDKTPALTIVAGQIDFDLYLTPAETTVAKGDFKYRVRITWPNGTDKNSIYGGKQEFKQKP